MGMEMYEGIEGRMVDVIDHLVPDRFRFGDVQYFKYITCGLGDTSKLFKASQ
jgi:hypothetical protein